MQCKDCGSRNSTGYCSVKKAYVPKKTNRDGSNASCKHWNKKKKGK